MSTFLSLRFPAGRYHATPWGSHVNEAEVEWPPSPWRILRAFVATWHRKMAAAQYPENALEALIERLSASLPLYRLPAMVRAHSRHYMPVRGRPVLIFDAFARIDREDELIVAWPDVTLDADERELLAALVRVTGYIGRAESWVEARLLQGYDGEFNCGPGGTLVRRDAVVPFELLAPLDPTTYGERRSRIMQDLGLSASRLNRKQRLILATLPPHLTDALRVETGDLRSAGWNIPPGGRVATYERARTDVEWPAHGASRSGCTAGITTTRLALAGRPLPRIEDAVRIGELLRSAAMSSANRLTPDGGVPPEISGHGSGDELNHQHAFYLPEDADADGFIDHVLVHAPGGLSALAVRALDQLHRRGLWTRDGEEWDVVFEGAWISPLDSRSTLVGTSRVWTSVTPYLHPWYSKPGFGIVEQVRRECGNRGLPAPVEIRTFDSIRIRGRERRPVHFHRFRSSGRHRQPDSRGSLLRITFEQPIAGPLALGFGCHYGLGMFRPAPA